MDVEFLEVGTNDDHNVVVNLPRDMTGHIVFSPKQAREFADTLCRKAHAAEAAGIKAAEELRIAGLPPVDRSNVATTNGKSAADVLAGQTNATGQHEGYIVLGASERAKGFVRPYRDAYRHTSCGSVTTMGRALSETYARDPKFYGATFCCGCNRHLPVSEFTWTDDGAVVGS